MSRYIVVYDRNNHEDFIAKKLSERGIPSEAYFSPLISGNFLRWFSGCFELLFKTKKNDTLIFWYDFQGIIAYFLFKAFFKKRNIIALNILLKNKRTLKNRVVAYLYNKALKDKSFTPTFTSQGYASGLLSRFQTTSISPFIISDPFTFPVQSFVFSNSCSVFVGGHNGRDWNFVVNLASRLPDIEFIAVVSSRKVFRGRELPNNIRVYENVTYEKFSILMSQASLVLFPLLTDAPAGLIVLYQAAAMCKAVIADRTPVTEDYITTEEEGILLNKSLQQYIDAIERLVRDSVKQERFATNLQQRYLEQNTQDKYIDKLEELIINNKHI